MLKKEMLKNEFSKQEEEVLGFWDKAETFEKSVKRKAPKGDYVFYDGPPFATGMPHYGHIVGSIMKDAVPRYWTMKGYRVERRWGWDCHGLPVENLAEQELKLKDKTDIEKIGVAKFNQYCESIVMRYAKEWRKIIKRIGRWVDMENDYKTMDSDYMESIWWVFKNLWDKGLIYQGHKAMHICPRCGTTLSNFEVTQNYKDIKDISCIAKFELETSPQPSPSQGEGEKTYILAWTTTPWTLIGNVALAVGEDVDYVMVKYNGLQVEPQRYSDSELKKHTIITPGTYILAKDIFWNNMQSNAGMQELRQIVGSSDYQEMKKDLLKNIKYEEFIKKYNIKEVKGKDLIGLEYKPLFDYYAKDKKLENRENGWKIYGADFVNIEEGTGVVHIAPAFGEDDMEMGKKYNLPFIQHVDGSGRFTEDVKDFAGTEVKPKDNHQATDIEIIKYLARKHLLFSKEKYEHSYPHCWRCETPLLNYAAESWFVKVTKIKNDLIKNNKKIHWVPEHIKDGRFGKWLEQARDWAISRNRYWGAPLPVWVCDECDEKKVIGSVKELAEAKGGGKFIIVRHGQAEHNLKNLCSAQIINDSYNLTQQGKKEAAELAKKLKKEKVELIICSDMRRTQQTAQILNKNWRAKIILEPGLRDIDTGIFEGKKLDELWQWRCQFDNFYRQTHPEGESMADVEKRAVKVLKGIKKKFPGKTILVVTHEDLIRTVYKYFDQQKRPEIFFTSQKIKAPPASQHTFYFQPIIDLHRPNIDKVEFKCEKCGGVMRRVPEVLDCWFESGSMPYAQEHYPFENKEKFEKNFPADFIAEGVDQTRGWFYTSHVLANALKIKDKANPAFKNVIVNGIVLAEDGQKMSKRLNNYPDPAELFEKYSVDAMRYYLLSSPVLLAENLNFSEDGVKESLRKVEMILWNVYKFYELFANNAAETQNVETQNIASLRDNVLDKWIIAKLNQLIAEVTENMDKYNLPKAVRPIEEFINDLSTWYIRRSRDRFKGEGKKDKQAALQTTGFVLLELSKVMAPFMPFIAEQIWQRVMGYDFKDKDKSVHLESWPSKSHRDSGLEYVGIKKGKKVKTKSGAFVFDGEAMPKDEKKVLQEMEIVRKIVELGLAKRDEAGIKVRQPLSELRIKNYELRSEYENLIKEELNVKIIKTVETRPVETRRGASLQDTSIKVELDTKITDELRQEGIKRELVRFINNLRKNAGMTIQDRARVFWKTENNDIKKAIKKYKNDILKDTLTVNIFNDLKSDADCKEVKINNGILFIKIEKI